MIQSGRTVAGHVGAAWRLCWSAGPVATVTLLLLAVVAGTLPVGTTWLTKLLLDGLTSGRHDVLAAVIGGLFGASLVAAVVPNARTLLQANLGRAVDLKVQMDLHTAVNGLDGLRHLEDPAFRDRLQLARSCTGPALAPATVGLFDLGADVISLVGLLATLWVLSPTMGFVVLVAAVPVLVAELSYSRQHLRLAVGMSETMRRNFFYTQLLIDLRAAKEIRVLRLAPFLIGRLRRTLTSTQTAARRLDTRVFRGQATLSLLGAMVAGGGFAWAATRAVEGRFTAGDLVAFVAAVAGVQGSTVALVSRLAQAGQALGFFGYYREVLATPNDVRPATGDTRLAPLRSGIELRNVWFRYGAGQPWVLRDVSLTIPHGATVGLVGLNGAGKSTIIKLLCRLYEPTRGTIRWDGVDLRAVSVGELRDRLGVMFQDFMTYDLTVAENVGIGDVTRVDDRAAVGAAGERAGIEPLVRGLPAGYDTVLSRIFGRGDDDGNEATSTLSGGQWQRIALARALMRRARDLLILDEPGSGLDPEAEHEVNRRVLDLRAGRTTLLVSHRLGVLREADLIVGLADGRVVEHGTHDNLMSADGLYARLFRLQGQPYAAAGT
jgi:ATP-binding cassette subfamily B protein